MTTFATDDDLSISDDQLRRGTTLPAAWYASHDLFARERRAVFGTSWQYAAHARHLQRPGDFVACRVGVIPLVVVLDEEGALRAFVNVCRHRGHEVAKGTGNRATLQCGYHGWTYGLDGCLRTAPRSAREASFDTRGLGLLPAQVDRWADLVFVNPADQSVPFREALDPVDRLAREWGLDPAFRGYTHRGTRRYEIRCNWKVHVENAMECYHCPIAHPSFSERVDVHPDTYSLHAHAWTSTQTSRRRAGREPAAHHTPDFLFFFLWPNFFLSADRSSFSTHTVTPVGVDETLYVVDSYFAPEIDDATAASAMEGSAAVVREDIDLVESVQVGLASGTVRNGRLLLDSESLVHHFQALAHRVVTQAAEGDADGKV